MRVSIQAHKLVGRAEETRLLSEKVLLAKSSGHVCQLMHIFGSEGVGVRALLGTWLKESEEAGLFRIGWRLERAYHFTGPLDCIQMLLENPLGEASALSQSHREELKRFLLQLEKKRQQFASEGHFVLYEGRGSFRTANSTGASLQNRHWGIELARTLAEYWRSFEGTEVILIVLDSWKSCPVYFRHWIGTELVEQFQQQKPGFPVVFVTSGTQRLAPADYSVWQIAASAIHQLEIKPLFRAQFREYLQSRNCPEESWEWLYNDCGGKPGLLDASLEKWNKFVLGGSASAGLPDWMDIFSPRTLSQQELFWIQTAAALNPCHYELFGFMVGEVRVPDAIRFLHSLDAIERRSDNIIELRMALRSVILSWMREHRIALLGECMRLQQIWDEVYRLAPSADDRLSLSYLAPCRVLEPAILEAIFPETS